MTTPGVVGAAPVSDCGCWPARRRNEHTQPTAEVVFTLRDGQKMVRTIAPDSADWFVVRTK